MVQYCARFQDRGSRLQGGRIQVPSTDLFMSTAYSFTLCNEALNPHLKNRYSHAEIGKFWVHKIGD